MNTIPGCSGLQRWGFSAICRRVVTIGSFWILLVLGNMDPPPTFGQIASNPLIQTGSLALSTGAYSPLGDQNVRAYALYQNGTSATHNLSTGSDSSTSLGEVVAADFAIQSGILSVGYNRASGKAPFDFLSPNGNANVTAQAAILGVGLFVTETVLAEVRLSLQTGDAQISQGSQSGTANHNYLDRSVGVSIEVVPKMRIGANFSPEVSNSVDYDGGNAGTQSHAGHGAQALVGAAYNAKTFTLEADLYQFHELLAAYAASASGLTLLGQRLFSTWLVGASFGVFTQSQLVDGSNYISPPTRGEIMQVKVSKVLDTWVLGLKLTQTQTTSSNFGNATADATRENSSTADTYEFTVLKSF